MVKKEFDIEYAEKAVKDVKSLRAFDQKKIVDAIEAYLLHAARPGKRAK